ncbi:Protein CBG27058 [Caenorhabditis briggsae]|uniref:Protein CBG27058 n=1 Tax=Caenorhabditis briggsae TaxID=6238 RepID=B6IMC2_CAEBR|nr:Protein CBG27058 [Caenorhabditis briggsae]CAS01052.1 Protein CBG27058 [Caenorhabditis briggsae]
MRVSIVLLLLLSIISLSFGNETTDSKSLSGKKKLVPKDYAGSEAHSTDPEKMKKMQMLQPKFRLMN